MRSADAQCNTCGSLLGMYESVHWQLCFVSPFFREIEKNYMDQGGRYCIVKYTAILHSHQNIYNLQTSFIARFTRLNILPLLYYFHSFFSTSFSLARGSEREGRGRRKTQGPRLRFFSKNDVKPEARTALLVTNLNDSSVLANVMAQINVLS